MQMHSWQQEAQWNGLLSPEATPGVSGLYSTGYREGFATNTND